MPRKKLRKKKKKGEAVDIKKKNAEGGTRCLFADDCWAASLCISHTPGKHLMPPDGAVTHFQTGGVVCVCSTGEEEEKKGDSHLDMLARAL